MIELLVIFIVFVTGQSGHSIIDKPCSTVGFSETSLILGIYVRRGLSSEKEISGQNQWLMIMERSTPSLCDLYYAENTTINGSCSDKGCIAHVQSVIADARSSVHLSRPSVIWQITALEPRPVD